jgi:NAD(P)-dependent dehydrogenase (short-subunit alcohol dehydrogenase family)
MSDAMPNADPLHAPVCVILGSGSRLGSSIALRALDRGYSVVLADINPGRFDVDTTAVTNVQVDVTDESSLVELFLNLPGPLAGCVYLPRLRQRTRWGSTSLDVLLADFSVSAGGFVLVAQALTHAVLQGLGAESLSVVAYSSALAHFISPAEGVSYHLAKAALEHAVRYASVELGPVRVRVNAISPGWVSRGAEFEAQLPTAVFPALRSTQALPDMAREEDLVNMTMFLLSSASSGVTGQILSLDGGLGLREPVSAAMHAINDDRRNAGFPA